LIFLLNLLSLLFLVHISCGMFVKGCSWCMTPQKKSESHDMS
jgi:hypothetical protein